MNDTTNTAQTVYTLDELDDLEIELDNIILGNITVSPSWNTQTTVVGSHLWGSPNYSNNIQISPDYGLYDPRIKVSEDGINLSGETDLTIGNVSLRDFMDTVSQRLALLKPNDKLEAEWEELKALGDQYRKLEAELLEKAQVWGILNR